MALVPRRQIANGLRGKLFLGRYAPGESLPSTRALASQLDVSKNTVEAAYRILIDEGFLTAVPWKGYIVREESDLMEARRELLHREIAEFQDRITALGFTRTEVAAVATDALSR